MNSTQVKKIVSLLTKKWDIQPALDMYHIIDELDGAVNRSCSALDTFEFSLIPDEKSLRLLHLVFYKPDITEGSIDILLSKRIDSIVKTTTYFNQCLNFCYNLPMLKNLSFLFNQTSWPVQFGCAIKKNAPPVIKLYLSTINSNFTYADLMKKICNLLGLNWDILKGLYTHNLFDAIGIDFLHDGCCRIKIYTFYLPPFNLSNICKIYQKYNHKDKHLNFYLALIQKFPVKHIGFLYRISSDSRIEAVKIWMRLRKKVSPLVLQSCGKTLSKECKKWLDSAAAIIDNVKAKISYLTFEKNNLGVYFR